jgi:hypothetical protein
MCSRYSTDVQRTEHDRVLPIGQCYYHGVSDNCTILRVLHAEHLSCARMNMKRNKGHSPKKTTNLL